MASHCVFLNVTEHDYHKNALKKANRCICCLSQRNNMIIMDTCEHTAFIRDNFTNELDISYAYICLICHSMLKKIEGFKQQVEESIALFTTAAKDEDLKVKKLYNLNNSPLQTTDSMDVIEEYCVKPVVVDITDQNQFDTEIKIENDSFDYETDTPLVEINNRKREKQVHKYDGKIRIVMLTLEELKEERENMARSEKYLGLPYRCEHCLTGFDHEITWKSHMEKRHTKMKNSYQCDVCKSVLNSKNSYNEHTKRHLKRLECMQCGKRYNTEQCAIQHYDEKHLPSGSSLQHGYTCKECGFTTTVNRTYRYHLDKHKQKRECTLCGNKFVNDNSLRMHMYTIHKQSSRVYRCDPCDKTYNAKSGLVAHMRSIHTHAPRAYCAACHTHYTSVNALQTHLKTHSRHVSDSDKRFICDECGAKFVTKRNLQIHINWEHLKLDVHTCVTCSKVFKYAAGLRRHVNYVHNKQRPPRNKVCHFCGRGFTTQNILQSHLRTHTGERPLQCQHCRATFAHSGALYTHIKLKHCDIK